MADRVVSSAPSADLVGLLVKRGMTLTQIARATRTTKSLISRVKARSRGLTIDHMIALEREVGEPLPLLLLQATPIESVSKKHRPLYRMTEKMLIQTSGRKPRRAVRRRSKAA